MMYKIPLTQGKFALVSCRDYHKLRRYKWYMRAGYAARHIYAGGKRYHQPMHREIMGLVRGDKKQVDHRNGVKIDNRRSNLRIASMGQNQQNRARLQTNTTGCKGVIYHKRDRHYVAALRHNGKRYWSRYFDNPVDAAKAYDKMAKKFHGRFAKLNFPR